MIREQEKDRLTPVSEGIINFLLSEFYVVTLLFTTQIIESLSSSYLGPDYSQVLLSSYSAFSNVLFHQFKWCLIKCSYFL